MKANKKSLQKLTVSQKKINAVLAKKQITLEDLEKLNFDEKERLQSMINEKFVSLKGEERDELMYKIDLFIGDEGRNRGWEINHIRITNAIHLFMTDFARTPSFAELQDKTGLSRQTIGKHLKEYATHSCYLEQVEQFRFMTTKVMGKVFQLAMKGDTGAAKLYLNFMGVLNGQQSNNTLIQNQNNYIQINGTVLSQETIKHLNPEQLNNLETILKTALPVIEKT